MARKIRARFSKGKIAPVEEVDLRERQEVKVIVPDHPKRRGMVEALRVSAGGWKGLLDAEELKRNIYANRLISTRPEPRL